MSWDGIAQNVPRSGPRVVAIPRILMFPVIYRYIIAVILVILVPISLIIFVAQTKATQQQIIGLDRMCDAVKSQGATCAHKLLYIEQR